MARFFTLSSSQYLMSSSFAALGEPATLAIWYNTNNTTDAQIILSVADSGSPSNFNIHLRGDSSDQVWAASTDSGGTISYAIAAVSYTPNVWQHACAVFPNTSERYIYVNGGNVGSNTATRAVTGVDRWGIGHDVDSGPFAYYDGALAEAAVWGIALETSDIAMLALGVSPLLIKPSYLVAYAPLIRDEDQDRVGGYHLTAYNSPTVATHPPQIKPIWTIPWTVNVGAPDSGPVLVDIDHDAGNLDEYTSLTGSEDLAATTGAAMAGTDYGLQVTVDDTDPSYGLYNTGVSDTSGVVAARIYLDPNGFVGGSSGQYLFVHALYPSSGVAIGYIWLQYTDSGYNVAGVIVNDVPENVETSWYAISDGPHYVEIRITRSDSGSPTGELKLWIDGELKETISTVDNYDTFYNFQIARLGCTYVSGAGTPSGSIYLDEMIVNNDGGYIGPLAGSPTWISPSNHSSISATPTLVFQTPTFTGNRHFNLQLDNDDTFSSGNLRNLRTNISQVNWEYWDGDSWEGFPSGGLPDTYAGNNCRYIVSSPLSAGTWYRRVRMG